ncbi:MAG TPA: hypothetical protein VFR15_09435 [Chloroflexia bacterium]|nr:hypothetical protein [Chloroflexia bacterium]
MIEHPDSARRDGDNMPATGRSALERIPWLEAASTVTVRVEILQESYEQILEVARASGYDEDEAVRLVLLSGLGYEKGRLNLDALNEAAALGTDLSAARVDAIVNELAGYHSMYSVLKFKAFKLYKQNQRLEFNNAGLRAQEKMWNEWADRMRHERDALGAEVIRLRALLSEFSLDWEASGGPRLPRGLLEAAQLAEHAEKIEAEPEIVPDDPAEEATDPPPAGFWARLKRFLTPD